MTNIHVTVDLERVSESIVNTYTEGWVGLDEILAFVEDIDLGVAEVEFTEELIKRLQASLNMEESDD